MTEDIKIDAVLLEGFKIFQEQIDVLQDMVKALIEISQIHDGEIKALKNIKVVLDKIEKLLGGK